MKKFHFALVWFSSSAYVCASVGLVFAIFVSSSLFVRLLWVERIGKSKTEHANATDATLLWFPRFRAASVCVCASAVADLFKKSVQAWFFIFVWHVCIKRVSVVADVAWISCWSNIRATCTCVSASLVFRFFVSFSLFRSAAVGQTN